MHKKADLFPNLVCENLTKIDLIFDFKKKKRTKRQALQKVIEQTEHDWALTNVETSCTALLKKAYDL